MSSPKRTYWAADILELAAKEVRRREIPLAVTFSSPTNSLPDMLGETALAMLAPAADMVLFLPADVQAEAERRAALWAEAERMARATSRLCDSHDRRKWAGRAPLEPKLCVEGLFSRAPARVPQLPAADPERPARERRRCELEEELAAFGRGEVKRDFVSRLERARWYADKLAELEGLGGEQAHVRESRWEKAWVEAAAEEVVKAEVLEKLEAEDAEARRAKMEEEEEAKREEEKAADKVDEEEEEEEAGAAGDEEAEQASGSRRIPRGIKVRETGDLMRMGHLGERMGDDGVWMSCSDSAASARDGGPLSVLVGSNRRRLPPPSPGIEEALSLYQYNTDELPSRPREDAARSPVDWEVVE